MSYVTAATPQEAFTTLRKTGVSIVAGGSDFFPSLGDQVVPPPILDITALPGFSGISQQDGFWRIGAATTWSEIAKANLPPVFRGLQAAAREVGSVQIQNRGTIGGNICNASPAADGVPPLLTLDAVVELISATGARQLPLSDFITGVRQTDLRPGELLQAILIPELPEGAISVFEKLGLRRYLVISIAMAAVVIVPDGRGGIAQARVAVGACSPVARRLNDLEYKLKDMQLIDINTQINADDFDELSPIGDVRASQKYRMRAAETLVRRMLAGFSKESIDG